MFRKDKLILLKAHLKVLESLRKHIFSRKAIDNDNNIKNNLQQLSASYPIYLASKQNIMANDFRGVVLQNPHFIDLRSASQDQKWVLENSVEVFNRTLEFVDENQQYLRTDKGTFLRLTVGGMADSLLDWQQLKDLFTWFQSVLLKANPPSLIFIDNLKSQSIALALASLCDLEEKGYLGLNLEEHIRLLQTKFNQMDENNPDILKQAVTIYVLLNRLRLFGELSAEIDSMSNNPQLFINTADFEKIGEPGRIDWFSIKNRLKLKQLLAYDLSEKTEENKILFDYLKELEKCLNLFEQDRLIPECHLLEISFNQDYLLNVLNRINQNIIPETFSDLLVAPIMALSEIDEASQNGHELIKHAVFGDGRLEDISWLLECLDREDPNINAIEAILYKRGGIAGYQLEGPVNGIWIFEVSNNKPDDQYAPENRQPFYISQDNILNKLINGFRNKLGVSDEEARDRILLNIQGPCSLVHRLGGAFSNLFVVDGRPLKEFNHKLEWVGRELVYRFSYGVNSSIPGVSFEYHCEPIECQVRNGLRPLSLNVTFNLDARDKDQAHLIQQVQEKCRALGCPVSFEDSSHNTLKFFGEKSSKSSPNGTVHHDTFIAGNKGFKVPYGVGYSSSMIFMPKEKKSVPGLKIFDEQKKFEALKLSIKLGNKEAEKKVQSISNKNQSSLLKKLTKASENLKTEEAKQALIKFCDFGIASSKKCPKFNPQNAMASWEAIKNYIHDLIHAFPYDDVSYPSIEKTCESRLYHCILKVFKSLEVDASNLKNGIIRDFFNIYENVCQTLIATDPEAIEGNINWLIGEYKAEDEQESVTLRDKFRTWNAPIGYGWTIEQKERSFNELSNYLKGWMICHFERLIYKNLVDLKIPDLLNDAPHAAKEFIASVYRLQNSRKFQTGSLNEVRESLLTLIRQFPLESIDEELHNYCAKILRETLHSAFKIYYRLDEDSTEIHEAISVFLTDFENEQKAGRWSNCDKCCNVFKEKISSVFSEITEAVFLERCRDEFIAGNYQFFARSFAQSGSFSSVAFLELFIALSRISQRVDLQDQYKNIINLSFFPVKSKIPHRLDEIHTTEQFVLVSRLIEESRCLPETFNTLLASFIEEASDNDKLKIVWLNKMCDHVFDQGFDSEEALKFAIKFFDDVLLYFRGNRVSRKEIFLDEEESDFLRRLFALSELYYNSSGIIDRSNLDLKVSKDELIKRLDLKVLDVLLYHCPTQVELNTYFELLGKFNEVVKLAEPGRKEDFYPTNFGFKKQILHEEKYSQLYYLFAFELALNCLKKSKIGEELSLNKDDLKKINQLINRACNEEYGLKAAFLLRALVAYVTCDPLTVDDIKIIVFNLNIFLTRKGPAYDNSWLNSFSQTAINQMIDDPRSCGVVVAGRDGNLFELQVPDHVENLFLRKEEEKEIKNKQFSQLKSSIFLAYHYLFQTDLWKALKDLNYLPEGWVKKSLPASHFLEGPVPGAQQKWVALLNHIDTLQDQDVGDDELDEIKQRLKEMASEKIHYPLLNSSREVFLQNDSSRSMIDAILNHVFHDRIDHENGVFHSEADLEFIKVASGFNCNSDFYWNEFSKPQKISRISSPPKKDERADKIQHAVLSEIQGAASIGHSAKNRGYLNYIGNLSERGNNQERKDIILEQFNVGNQNFVFARDKLLPYLTGQRKLLPQDLNSSISDYWCGVQSLQMACNAGVKEALYLRAVLSFWEEGHTKDLLGRYKNLGLKWPQPIKGNYDKLGHPDCWTFKTKRFEAYYYYMEYLIQPSVNAGVGLDPVTQLDGEFVRSLEQVKINKAPVGEALNTFFVKEGYELVKEYFPQVVAAPKQKSSPNERRENWAELQLENYIKRLLLAFEHYNRTPTKGTSSNLLGIPTREGSATWMNFIKKLHEIYAKPGLNAQQKMINIESFTKKQGSNISGIKGGQHARFLKELETEFWPREGRQPSVDFATLKALANVSDFNLVMNRSKCYSLLADLKAIELDNLKLLKKKRLSPLDQMALHHLYSNIRSLAANSEKLEVIVDIDRVLRSRVRQFVYYGHPDIVRDKDYQSKIDTVLVKSLQEKGWLSYSDVKYKSKVGALSGILAGIARDKYFIDPDRDPARDRFSYKLGRKVVALIEQGWSEDDAVKRAQIKAGSWEVSPDEIRAGSGDAHSLAMSYLDPINADEYNNGRPVGPTVKIITVEVEEKRFDRSRGMIVNKIIKHRIDPEQNDEGVDLEVMTFVQSCLKDIKHLLSQNKLHGLLHWGLSRLVPELDKLQNKMLADKTLGIKDFRDLITQHLFFLAEDRNHGKLLQTFKEKEFQSIPGIMQYTYTFGSLLNIFPGQSLGVDFNDHNPRNFVQKYILRYLSRCTLDGGTLPLMQRFVLDLGLLLMKEDQDKALTPQRLKELFIQAMPAGFTIKGWLQKCEQDETKRQALRKNNQYLYVLIDDGQDQLFKALRKSINLANQQNISFSKQSTLAIVESVIVKDPGDPKNQGIFCEVSTLFSSPQASLAPVLRKSLQLLAARLEKIDENDYEVDDVKNLVSQYLFFLNDSTFKGYVPDAIRTMQTSLGDKPVLAIDILQKLNPIRHYLKIVMERERWESTSTAKIHFALELGRLLMKEAQEGQKTIGPDRLDQLRCKALKCSGLEQKRLYEGACGRTIGAMLEDAEQKAPLNCLGAGA